MRVGRIPYVNCYPVYGAIDRNIVSIDAELVDGVPTALNRAMADGALDVSVVWQAIAGVQRNGRDIIVSLVDSRRRLRFCCHAPSEAARGAVVATYLANVAARAREAESTTSQTAAL